MDTRVTEIREGTENDKHGDTGFTEVKTYSGSVTTVSPC